MLQHAFVVTWRVLRVGPVFKLINTWKFDPIWFGVMLVAVSEIGMIVLPAGIHLFVIQTPRTAARPEANDPS